LLSDNIETEKFYHYQMRSAETIRANFQTEESLLYFVVSKDGGKIF